MIDLHCHLLPGIDGGLDPLAKALEWCRIAVASQCMPKALAV